MTNPTYPHEGPGHMADPVVPVVGGEPVGAGNPLPVASPAGALASDDTLAQAVSQLVAAVTILQGILAGVNDSGTLNVAQDVSTMKNGATSLTPKFAKIDTTADGSIVPAVGGKKIVPLAIFAMASADDTMKLFSDNGSGAVLSGSLPVKANGGFVLPFCPVGWCSTLVGEALYLDVSSGATVGGLLVYAEV
jgi:hypothetical protein